MNNDSIVSSWFFDFAFDDIRPEEYTPSYAGGSQELIFCLKMKKSH